MDNQKTTIYSVGRLLSWEGSSWTRYLPTGSIVLLSAYFILMLPVYPRWCDLWPSLAGAAAALGILSMFSQPPSERPSWPYWAFVGGSVGFILVNLLAVLLADRVPDIGKTHAVALHIPGVLVALAAGLGLRRPRYLTAFLAVILIVSGIWYLSQAVGLFWTSPYREGKLILSRAYHTVLAMELVLMLSLFMGHAALAENRRHAICSLLGAILLATLLLMTKTRSALIVMAFVTIPGVAIVQNRWGTFRRRLVASLVLLLVLAPMSCIAWYAHASPERRSLANVFARFHAWAVGIQISMERPWNQTLWGSGHFVRTFPATAKHFGVDPHTFEGEELQHAHNVLLQTFIETGILGTVALILIWTAAAYRALLAWTSRGKTVAGVMVIALLTAAVMGQMDYCLDGLWGVESQICWFIVGLAFASGSLERS